MATPSRGIGRGGRRDPVGGRPKGSISRKARELLAEAEAKDLLTPLAFLLEIVRDPKADRAERIQCAAMSAPYLHARLSSVKLAMTPDNMTDAELMEQLARHERQFAEMPDADRAASFEGDLRRMAEGMLQLSRPRQRMLFSTMAKIREEGEARLAKEGGEVPPREPLRRAGAPSAPNGTTAAESPPQPNGHRRIRVGIDGTLEDIT